MRDWLYANLESALQLKSPVRDPHYNNVIMGTMTSQITSLTIVYLNIYSSADQRKHQSSVSSAIVRGIHRWPVNHPDKWPVTRKIYPFDDVIMPFRYNGVQVQLYLWHSLVGCGWLWLVSRPVGLHWVTLGLIYVCVVAKTLPSFIIGQDYFSLLSKIWFEWHKLDVLNSTQV